MPKSSFDAGRLLAAALFLGAGAGHAALFTAQTNQTDIPNLYNSRAAWCDYDRDGWMDFAITGTLTNTTSTGVTRLYRWNNSQGRFVLTQTLADHREGSLAWADFNRDGNPDLLVTGLAPNGQGGQSAITSIYAGTNQSTGYPLTRLDPPSTGLPGTNGGGYIGDFNKDGRADILFVSNGSGGASTRVFQNFSDFWFVEVANTGLTHVGSEPAAAIADFDLDGHQDVVLSGKEGSGSALIRVFRGKGDGTFTNKRTLSPGLWDGALAVGD